MCGWVGLWFVALLSRVIPRRRVAVLCTPELCVHFVPCALAGWTGAASSIGLTAETAMFLPDLGVGAVPGAAGATARVDPALLPYFDMVRVKVNAETSEPSAYDFVALLPALPKPVPPVAKPQLQEGAVTTSPFGLYRSQPWEWAPVLSTHPRRMWTPDTSRAAARYRPVQASAAFAPSEDRVSVRLVWGTRMKKQKKN